MPTMQMNPARRLRWNTCRAEQAKHSPLRTMSAQAHLQLLLSLVWPVDLQVNLY